MNTDDKKALEKEIKLMRTRLVKEGKKLQTEDLVVEYDNGGGQSGMRENPFYTAYEKLFKCYTGALSFMKEMEADNKGETDITSLDDFRSKFKIAK